MEFSKSPCSIVIGIIAVRVTECKTKESHIHWWEIQMSKDKWDPILQTRARLSIVLSASWLWLIQPVVEFILNILCDKFIEVRKWLCLIKRKQWPKQAVLLSNRENAFQKTFSLRTVFCFSDPRKFCYLLSVFLNFLGTNKSQIITQNVPPYHISHRQDAHRKPTEREGEILQQQMSDGIGFSPAAFNTALSQCVLALTLPSSSFFLVHVAIFW